MTVINYQCYNNIMGFLWLIEDIFDEYKINLIFITCISRLS